MIVKACCPAKVNLFLSVGPPDASGYHPIRTVFQAIGLFDELVVSDEGEPGFVCDSDAVPSDNTVTKALRLIRELVEVPPLRIELKKRIPAQAGLGGGSSNAAGLIRAVLRLTGADLPWGQTETVAAVVGADVPFFLVGGRARAEGYGEVLTALPDQPPEWALVVQPKVRVSTADAYRRLDEKPREWKSFPDGLEHYNDFERVAPCECLELIERLESVGASRTMLAGSGSAVFGWFATETGARAAQAGLDDQSYDGAWVAPSLTRKESLWTS